MSSYESYLKKAQNSAKKQQKEYETQRNKQLQKTINALASAAATEQKALRQTHAQQSKACSTATPFRRPFRARPLPSVWPISA